MNQDEAIGTKAELHGPTEPLATLHEQRERVPPDLGERAD
jgi:hypothetical protein